ncbi:MAG: dihydrolipoyllysine-residue succinyltransferase component of 2-oxoglutarate dehydrogenase complex [Thermomicrobiales bacterium]|nr:MAG: dihydrolipoyllysine-residue succinyltransferase component of 2-oxoglutarate dehydrogenase complex [Thermomicrobiales bacterium]
MPVEIRVPPLGESLVDAVVGQWLKHEGDPVSRGDTLLELETDKVNLDVTATEDGVLSRIEKREGEVVKVGDVLGIITEAAVAPTNGAKAAEAAQVAAPAPAPVAAAPAEVAAAPAAPPAEAAELAAGGRAAPAVRRLAEEHQVDINLVPGTGPGGRVTREDVLAYVARQAAPAAPVAPAMPPAPAPAPPAPPVQPSPAPAPAPHVAPAAPPAVSTAAGRREERVRMTRRRQTIAARLVEAQRTAAMLTTFNEIDMTAVIELRKARREAFQQRYGVSLGFMSFFTKACVGALKAFPYLNAEIQGDEIVVKHYYDIGIAVSTDEGLVVPVVRDADRKTFAEIEREIADVATRAREGKLTLAELQGGTFTITNGGVFGSLLSTPILNYPQVGILGMHKIQERPVAINGQVVIRPMMYVALSYDHRIVDGSEAVRFLVRVKELVEDPTTLLLEG